jgi:FAD synthetase
MTTVLCFGTFDGLHPGHEHYFCQAKELGDRVVVVVARDATVLDVKGQLPARYEGDRLAAVKAFPVVDEALLGNPGDKYAIIETVRPDIILLGYDQKAFTDKLVVELEARGLSPSVRRAKPFEPHRFKSSLLREPLPNRDAKPLDEDALPL